MFYRFVFSCPLICLLLVGTVSGDDFRLQDGDRVVFLGDGLIEQEQYFGWVELMMTTSFPDKQVSFRNLGWNGDTPAGASRLGLSLLQAGREPEGEGWRQLRKQLEQTEPTVLVLGYGMASSLEGGAGGVESFVDHYQRLLEAARQISPQVRFVFLSPIGRSDASDPHAEVLLTYAAAIARMAERTDSPFVDLTQVAMSDELRKDPVHLNEAGYKAMAGVIEEAFDWGPSGWRDGGQAEVLRRVIRQKNQWWFHRSRPANMAYVFGFRKHEQGQNAVEIPQFDPLIEREEAKIAKLRALQPVDVQVSEPRRESKFAKFIEQSLPEFTLGEDLEVSLWAENPQLNKPIQMNFDPQGRLWVASSQAYPMIEVGQAAPDKIIVLEDTDSDGKADQSTVFADGLLIPTGVLPGDGGVYVAQSTDLLHLKDTDGDGRADVTRRVLSGFGTEDTHHNLHTLRWGPDGRMYMNQSIYTRSNTETPHDVVRLRAGGGFRYNTDTMKMQIFFRGLFNAWGHQFNDYGQSFLSDGAGFSGLAYAFPGAKFSPTPGAKRQLDLISPGRYPKFCSLEVISGKTFPPEWQGSIITCDFRANRVTRFSLEDQGAGFVTRAEDDVMRTSASTFRPIDVKQGPDGALYIADWSNPIINHGEVDFRDERRDRWHGRIWRVTWKGAKPLKKVNLYELSTEKLIQNLADDDRYTREQSRRVLIERDNIQPQLDAWMATQTDATARLQGMWLYQARGSLHQLPMDLLRCEDGRVRAAAVRVVGDFADPAADHVEQLPPDVAVGHLRNRVTDDHPRVRLEAVVALGKLRSVEATFAALEVLSQPTDRFIEFALASAVDEASAPLMKAIESGDWVADTPAKRNQLAFVLTSIEPDRATKFLADRLRDTPMARDGSGPWIDLIATAGGASELRILFEQAVSDGFEVAATRRALQTLIQAARLRKVRPSGPLDGLGRFLQSDDTDIRRSAATLAGVWKVEALTGRLAELASRSDASEAVREAAIEALREIGGKKAVEALRSLAEEPYQTEIRRRAVVALAGLNPSAACEPFYQLLRQVESEEDALRLWRSMLGARGVGKVLAANLPANGLPEMAAKAGVRACRDGGRNEPKLLDALLPLAGMTLTAEAFTPERMQELLGRVRDAGDPGRGESIYLRKELGCVGCHAIGGVGGRVGPDMTSLGASAPLDYIIESLFDPNAKIKEGYHSITVLTEDGMIFSGVEGDSTDDELLLRDANNKVIRIPVAEILDEKAGKSLMPTGVIDRLPIDEQVDLISFLSRLGKPGPFDASRGGVARTFEVLAGTHRLEQEGAERIIDGSVRKGWQPLVSRVNGDVNGSVLRQMTRQPINIALVNVYLRTTVDVPRSGPVQLAVGGVDKAALWIDGARIDGDSEFRTELEAGRHTVLVRLDGRDLPETFRLSSADVMFASEVAPSND